MTLIIPPKIIKPSPDIDIQFLNTSISANDQIKYLGITIDSRLNFKEDIVSMSNVVMSNAVWCTLCKKWIHARCSKMKKVSCSFTQQLVCRRCEDIGDGKEEPVEVLCD